MRTRLRLVRIADSQITNSRVVSFFGYRLSGYWPCGGASGESAIPMAENGETVAKRRSIVVLS
jgi:hypothetical protein